MQQKGRTQCTRLPLYAGSRRGECRLTLPPFMERLLPSLEPETWAKALAIAPKRSQKLMQQNNIISRKPANHSKATMSKLTFLTTTVKERENYNNK
ncbi:hypothetical protein C1H46_045295 [Malus baccata]|uniref:Uncharacterized protein n=1 Tax=Malus baccata TaxID=106549 RepID=A0A540K5L3_MALBA|nr:hypothetical protein C1H46_045295 [Malus baccata]